LFFFILLLFLYTMNELQVLNSIPISVGSDSDIFMKSLSTSNILIRDLCDKMVIIGGDLKKMQEASDALEIETQKEFLLIVQDYNKVICLISLFSTHQLPVIRKLKVAVELQSKQKFNDALKDLKPEVIVHIMNDITLFSTCVNNFAFKLKVTHRMIWKDWKFWLAITLGAISAVGAVVTLGMSLWVELAIAAGIMGGCALVGVGALCLLNKKENKNKVTHTNDLKLSLIAANTHLLQMRVQVGLIGEKYDNFIIEMFRNKKIKSLLEETILLFNNLDKLLLTQITT